MINSQDIKNGVCIRMDGRLYFVVEFLHVKPGKGNTIMRVKFKDVVDGRVLERRFNIGEKLEDVRVERRPYQYLYQEGDDYIFMNQETFEQIPIAHDLITGVDFLRRVNQDTSVKLSGDVVVVGGGNVAADVARTALRVSDGKGTMLCLESREEMPAAKDEIAEVEEEGITIMNGWGPKEVLSENGKVTGIVFKKCVSVFNSQHRFAPVYDENETITVPCSNILMAIGQSADWGDLLEGTNVQLRGNGTAMANPTTFQTNEPDIFVGGDIYHGAKFAIDAIADGKEGMVSINRFVHPGQSLTIGRDLREFIELDRGDIQIESYDNAERQAPGLKTGNAAETFDDLRLPLTEEQVKAEAGRCLKCGATIVDLNQCIGCGLCTTRCQFDAIHLSRDIPHAADMHTAEEMMKCVGPYALQRGFKIIKRAVTGKSEYPTEQTN